MNNKELIVSVNRCAYLLLKKYNYIAPVDLLIEMDVLEKKDYEEWRRGNIEYMEKVCKINLAKLSLAMKELRAFSRRNNLKPSWTFYKQWENKGRKVKLMFSKCQKDDVEKNYATHYVSTRKNDENIVSDSIQN